MKEVTQAEGISGKTNYSDRKTLVQKLQYSGVPPNQIIPSKKPHFRYGKISSPREWGKWSLGLGQHLKGASPNVRTESH